MTPLLTILIPVYRNRATLQELYKRLIAVLEKRQEPFEILFIDDACPEDSFSILTELASADRRIVVVALKENAGQNIALMTGLAYAAGETIVTMDADLQDEPEFIPAILEELKSGYHVVFAGKHGAYESLGRRISARLFKTMLYFLTMGRLPLHSGLFMAMDRMMATRLLENPIRQPHILTLMGLTGLTMTSIPYRRHPRSNGGSSYTTALRMKTAISAWNNFLTARNPWGNEKFRTPPVRAHFRKAT
ncbi:glycosyltransferase family 2 protein [bacterium]|nr:glycosyltransferase family 2 protein [bacterium]